MAEKTVLNRALSMMFLTAAVAISPALSMAADDAATVDFTDEERTWLEAHPTIRLGIMDAWPPMNFVNERGVPSGLGVDWAAALNRRLGNRLVLEPAPFQENYDRVKNKQLDALMDITPKKEREPFFEFTNPYLTIPHVFIGRKSGLYFNTEEDLIGRTVALEKGFYNVTLFRTDYPGVSIREYETTSLALDAVARGEADAYAGNRAVATYLIEKELLAGLQVQGRMKKSPVVLTIGTRKDRPELAAILDRALASITQEEIRQIHRKWLGRFGDAASVQLTRAEQAWIEAHPVIHLGVDQEFVPFEFVSEDGKYSGMAADYLELLAARLGLEFKAATDLPWDQAVERAKRRELDMLPCVGITEERKQFFSYTRPYLQFVRVIVTRKDSSVRNMQDLAGMRTAVQRNSSHHGFVKERTGIEPVLYDTFEASLLALSRKEVDAVIGNLAVAAHVMRELTLTNLKIATYASEETFPLACAVRKDWPELVALLDKALATVTPDERAVIRAKWVPVTLEDRRDQIRLVLTGREKAWLEEHPVITVAADPRWAPVEFRDDGGAQRGITRDFMDRIAGLLGVTFRFAGVDTWAEGLAQAERGEVDMLSAAMRTPLRRRYFDFTDTYLTLPSMIFTREDHPFVPDLRELAGKPVAVVEGFATIELLRADHPELNLVETKSVDEALRLLASGEVDAFLGALLCTSHHIRKQGYADIKIAGELPFAIELSMAPRKDLPLLLPILNKALAAIDEEERNGILRKWHTMKYEHTFDYSLLWKWLAVGLVVVAAFAYWNRRLSAEIAERTRVERDLVASQGELREAKDAAEAATRAKSDFLANMSHELRTPLNSVIGFSEVLYDETFGPLNAKQKDYLNDVLESGRHLLSLINDILDLSKVESGKMDLEPSPLVLQDVLEGSLVLIKEKALKHGIGLETDVADDTGTVVADERKVKQILFNLLSNAAKFTPDGGRIGIRARRTNGRVRVSVWDTGIGIEKDDQEKIFEEFEQIENPYSKQYAGTGLGLSLTRRLVEMHRGTIWVESEGTDKGTTFTFELPIDVTAEANDERRPEDDTAGRG